MNKTFTIEELKKLSYLDIPGGSSASFKQALERAATLLGFEGEANSEATRIMRAFLMDFFAARISILYCRHDENPEIVEVLDQFCRYFEVRVPNSDSDPNMLKNFLSQKKPE